MWTFGTELPELLFEHFPSTAYPDKVHAVFRCPLEYVRWPNSTWFSAKGLIPDPKL